MATTQRQRYREIADVLVRYGWSTIVDQSGLGARIPGFVMHLAERMRAEDGAKPDPLRGVSGPVRLRMALEELGPTFIKLGQMLATRSDILPADYTTELDKLQSDATPVPFDQIRAITEKALGDPDKLFTSIDPTPLGVASIGQTHAAILASDGSAVVLKVRKPGVKELVDVDLSIMTELSDIASKQWAAARDWDIQDLVAGFAASMRRELDFTTEAHSCERMATEMAGDPVVMVPAVHMDLCSEEVLTEQKVGGMRIDDTKALDAAGIDRKKLAEGCTRSVIRMVMIDGFFHADPHPGNMFVRPDGRIWLIDYGMVGELSPRLRGDLLWLLLGVEAGSVDKVSEDLIKLAPPRRGVDRPALRRDVSKLLATVHGKSLADISLVAFFSQLTGLLRRHRLQLPEQVSLLLRMLVLLDSTAVTLDPEFKLGAVLAEVGRSAVMDQWGPHALLSRIRSDADEAMRMATELPGRLSALLDQYEAHGVQVQLPAEDLEPLIERLQSTGDRLIGGMTMSALLICISSVLAASGGRVGRLRDPLMLASGVAAGVIAAQLAAGGGTARGAVRFIRRMVG